MSIFDLEETLGIYNINLKGSSIFFAKVIRNIRKAEWIKLSKERLENFNKLQHKEIIGQSTESVIYRIAGKLFVNRLNSGNWEAVRVY